VANDEENLTTGFFLNKQKPFFSLAFNQSRCHGKSTPLNQNARINSTVEWLTFTLAKNRHQIINSLKVMVN